MREIPDQVRDRLTGNIVTAFGCAVAGDQERRVVAQRVEIVGVLVTRANRHHARRYHGGVGVCNEQRVARIGQGRRDHVRHAETEGGLAQDDQSAIGGQVARVLASCERLASDG